MGKDSLNINQEILMKATSFKGLNKDMASTYINLEITIKGNLLTTIMKDKASTFGKTGICSMKGNS